VHNRSVCGNSYGLWYHLATLKQGPPLTSTRFGAEEVATRKRMGFAVRLFVYLEESSRS